MADVDLETRTGGAPPRPRVRSRPDPAWLRAPTVLAHYPRLAVAVVAAAVVVGLTTAAGPVFLASARDAALAGRIEDVSATDLGATVLLFSRPSPSGIDAIDTALTALLEDVPGLTAVDRTMTSTRLEFTVPGGEGRARLLARTGAMDHVDLVSGASGEGALLPASLADAYGLAPGDPLTVHRGLESSQVPVVGVYADLGPPMSDYWRPLSARFFSTRPPELYPPPPPVILLSPTTFLEVARAVGDNVAVEWRAPVADGSALDHERASSLVAELEALDRRLRDGDDALGAMIADVEFPGADTAIHSLAGPIMEEVDAAVRQLESNLRPLTLAAQLIAMLVVAAAGTFVVSARSVEIRRGWAQGRPPVRQGAQGALESLVPIVGGAVAGWVLARALVAAWGPSGTPEPDAAAQALPAVVVVSLVAVALIGLVTGLSAAFAYAPSGRGRVRSVLSATPWELVVLLLAGIAYYEVATRGALPTTGDGAPRVDWLLIAFPFLALIGTAGLGVRVMGWLLPRLQGGGSRLPLAPYLALRRLGDARGLALVLLAAVAVASGLGVHALTVVESTSQTVEVRSLVRGGAPTMARVNRVDPEMLDQVDVPFTPLVAADARLRISEQEVELVGIHPATFPDVVSWHPSLGAPSARAVTDRLGGGDVVPAVAVGDVPSEGTLVTTNYPLPYRVVERLEGFPGAVEDRPYVIVDAVAMTSRAEASGSSVPVRIMHRNLVWSTSDPSELEAQLSRAGILTYESTTAGELAANPAVRSLTWTFDLLAALAGLTVVLALAGLLLYLNARQADLVVAYVLARRMGLRSGSHWLALALELTGLVLLALAIGAAGGLVVARAVYEPLAPFPTVPPEAVFAVPWVTLGTGAGVLVAGALVGATWVQRSADRADASEVLRLAR